MSFSVFSSFTCTGSLLHHSFPTAPPPCTHYAAAPPLPCLRAGAPPSIAASSPSRRLIPTSSPVPTKPMSRPTPPPSCGLRLARRPLLLYFASGAMPCPRGLGTTTLLPSNSRHTAWMVFLRPLLARAWLCRPTACCWRTCAHRPLTPRCGTEGRRRRIGSIPSICFGEPDRTHILAAYSFLVQSHPR